MYIMLSYLIDCYAEHNVKYLASFARLKPKGMCFIPSKPDVSNLATIKCIYVISRVFFLSQFDTDDS